MKASGADLVRAENPATGVYSPCGEPGYSVPMQKTRGVCVVLGAMATVLAGSGLSGCGSVGRIVGSGSAQLESSIGGGSLNASGSTRVYRVTDARSAVIYVTDLPESALNTDADPASANGMILQVHVLVPPEAGETPIAPSACNTAVRVLIVSNGEVGVYAGGAFSFADMDDLGEKDFGASLRGGTMRLTQATPGFIDRLVHAKVEGSVGGTLNEDMARQIAARFAWLSAMTTPLDSVGYMPELALFNDAPGDAATNAPVSGSAN